MALFEVLVLDGLTVTGDPTGTLVLEAFSAPPPKQKPEWITGADSENAALFRGPLHDNREITMRIRVAQQATMNAALDQIGQIADKLAKADNNPDGIAMTWTPADSTRTVTFDVLAGEITDLPITWNGDDHGWFARRPVLNVTLTCKPYWRGTETLTSTASSSTPFVTMELANVPGDVPALGRLIVSDTATQARRHVEWGLESSSTYNSAASLLIDSDLMLNAGTTATYATRTNAYDPNAINTNVIRVTAYGFVGAVPLGFTGTQAHVGTFRVKARVYTDTTSVRFRLAWQVGDGPFQPNQWVAPPVAGAFNEVDLGTITVPAATLPAQRWNGRVDVMYTVSGTATVDLDYLLLVPVDAGYGKARGTEGYQPGGVTAVDDFNTGTNGAALAARVPVLGAAWVTSGAAQDFTLLQIAGASTVDRLFRGTTSDTAARVGVLGAAQTDTDVAASTFWSAGIATIGVTARYVDANNYLAAYVTNAAGVSGPTLRLRTIIVVTGGPGTLGTYDIGSLPTSQWLRVRLIVRADGNWSAVVGDTTGSMVLGQLAGFDARLATGGTHASGKAGIYDFSGNTVAETRWYDDVVVATPAAATPVIYSGRNMQIRHDTVIRQETLATFYGPPPSYRGSRFTVQPGTSRVLVKARRYDVELAADDPVTDALQVQVGYTPRGLVVPR